MTDDVPQSLVNELIAMHLPDITPTQTVSPRPGLRQELFERVFAPQKVLSFLREIPNANAQAVVVADPDGRIEWVSPAFSRMCGYTLHELKGQKAGTMLQGEDTAPSAVEALRDGIRNKRRVHAQLINYSKGGERYGVDIELFPTFEHDGSCNGFIAIEKEVGEFADQAPT
jgi:PAS domain S-box-containing protein